MIEQREPVTIANWLIVTRKPRIRAGEISAMYMGDTTEANPTPTPPRMRKALNWVMFEGKAEPIAPTP